MPATATCTSTRTRYPLAPTATFKPPHAPASAYRAVQRELGLARDGRRPADRLRLRQPLHAGRARRARPGSARGRRRRAGRRAGRARSRCTTLGVRGVRYMMLPGGVLPWSGARAHGGGDRAARLAHRPAARRPRAAAARSDARALAVPAGDRPRRPVPGPGRARQRSRCARSAGCSTAAAAGSRSRRRTKARAAARPATTTSPGSRALVARRYPERCLWASNWPHPNQNPAPSNAAMLDWASTVRAIRGAAQDPVDNPAELYGFAPVGRHVNFAPARSPHGLPRKPLRRRRAERRRQIEPGQGAARARLAPAALDLAHHAKAARPGPARARIPLRRRADFRAMVAARRVRRMGRGARPPLRHLARRDRGAHRRRPRRAARDRLAGRAADQAALPERGADLHPAAELGRAALAPRAARRGRRRGDRAADGERARSRWRRPDSSTSL